MKHPWWMKGVPFTCQSGCGKCCDEPDGIVYLSMHDAKRISGRLGMEVTEWLSRDCRKTLDGRYVLKSRECFCYMLPYVEKCAYLHDTNRCT